MTRDYDYILIGSGAGGSTLAYRLAEQGYTKVLVLESGGPDFDPLLRMPLARFLTEGDKRYLYRYSTEAVNGAHNPETWVRGRVVGGSAAINSMIYSRGQQADFDALAAAVGSNRWGWRSVLAAYRAMEDHALGASSVRGSGGRIAITVNENRSDTDADLAGLVLDAGRSLGWRVAEDVNDGDDERIGATPTLARDGARSAAGGSFLAPAAASGVTVHHGVHAERVLFQGGRAVGVLARRGHELIEYRAAREVVVACGAIESPLLLERSGIGEPTRLRRLGIEPVVASPHVGERVIEHRLAAIQVRFNRAVGSAAELSRAVAEISDAHDGAAGRSPARTRTGFEFTFHTKSDPALGRPDIAGHIGGYTLDPNNPAADPTPTPGMLVGSYLLRPETRGSFHATGASGSAPPQIEPRYLETDADREAAGAGFLRVRELLAASPLAEVIAGEDFPGDAVSTSQAAVVFTQQHGAPGNHAVGSCAMGPNPDDVLDPQLRVRGVDGLRIVDASALPFQVSANSSAPVMALAWIAADLMQHD